MQISWTVTDGAQSDYTLTYSHFTFGGPVVSHSENSSKIRRTTFIGTNEIAEAIAPSGTYSTTSTREAQVMALSTFTLFDTDAEEPLFVETTSASWNATDSSIEIYTLPTTLTTGANGETTAKEIYLKSEATFLQPFSAAYPTVWAWHEVAGYSVPNASEASAAQLSLSGQYTETVPAGDLSVSLKSWNGSVDTRATVTETWLSTTLTWTRTEIATGQSTTTAVGNQSIELTFGTQAQGFLPASTKSTSAAFFRTHTYISGQTTTVSNFWSSTALTAATYAVGQTTITGSTTTTLLVSSSAKQNIDILIGNVNSFGGFAGSATVPSAILLFRPNLVSGRQLVRNSFASYATANAGHALSATQAPAVALSHADNSFELPPAPLWFNKVSWQKGVFAFIPGQTRSTSSESSSTYWSLGHSKVSMTTRTRNETTSGQTTSTYGLSTTPPTAWSAAGTSATPGLTGSAAGAVFAVGGNYPTQSFVAAGGVVSATCGTSTYTTSGTISVSSAVTAFYPLPFFREVAGAASPIGEVTNSIATRQGSFGLRSITGALTA